MDIDNFNSLTKEIYTQQSDVSSFGESTSLSCTSTILNYNTTTPLSTLVDRKNLNEMIKLPGGVKIEPVGKKLNGMKYEQDGEMGEGMDER